MSDDKRSLYVRIRQYFQPYWHPMPEELKTKKRKSAPVTSAPEVDNVKPDKPKLIIKRINRSLEKAFFAKQGPKQGEIWYYHSPDKHQVYAYFKAGDRKKFGQELRNDELRRQLKAKIYPKNEQFDRTHLFPFGYIGTENNPVLVIGWRAQHNRNDIADFENRISDKDYDVHWLTSIEKTPYGAKWVNVVRRADNNELVDSLELTMGTNTKPVEFYWEDE